MKIIDQLKNKRPEFIDKNIPENLLYSETINYIKKNIVKILIELNPEEAFIFYNSYKNKEGFNPYRKDKTKEDIDKAIESLENKLIAYKLRSIQNITPVTKVYIFDEIREILHNFTIYSVEDIIKNISNLKQSINLSYIDMPQDMFHIFYSYGCIVKKEFIDQYFSSPEIDYFLNNGIKQDLLYVEGNTIHQVYAIDTQKVEEKEREIIKSVSYNTRIFNDVIKLIYTIIKTNILINKSGKINKKHFDILLKEVSSEVILNFLLKMLTKYNFVRINEENLYIYPTEKLYNFFKNSIENIYELFIETDEEIKEIYNIILTLKEENFGIQDIMAYLVKKKIKNPEVILKREIRRKVIEALEILFYLGILIKKHTTDGLVFYSINKKYKEISNEKYSKEKTLMVTPNMKVYAYLNKLDLLTSYILNIFLDIESYEEIAVYSISPSSIKRAVYFNNDINTLIETLKSKSKELPENVEINIKNFSKKVKIGKIENAILIRFDEEDIIDRIITHPEYSSLIIERISKKDAIVSKDIFNTRIMEDISVYFKINS